MSFYSKWVELALEPTKNFPEEEAHKVLDENTSAFEVALASGKVREKYFGKKVRLHQINNIQNGLCPEDCGYCGQSKITNANIPKYAMKSDEEIIKEAKEAKEKGAFRYCMVASGRGPNEKQAKKLSNVIAKIRDEVGIKTCLSVGLVSQEQAQLFKEAGLDRLNHNLNTSRKHTPKIVSTHTYEDRLKTIQVAKKAGLGNCSGMIVGMGESNQDIIDVAYELKRLEASSIPINFLIPIEGNKLYDFGQLCPERCIKILCLFRFINPTAELRVGGGREGHLRGLQSLALYPANSFFVEGYLVTRGSQYRQTVQLIEDAGFELEQKSLIDKEEKKTSFDIDGNYQLINPKILASR